MLNRPASPSERDHRVRRVMGVGLRPELWDIFQERFGLRTIYEMYGATEMNLVWTNVMNLPRTCGRSLYPFAVVRFDVELGEPARGADGRMIRVRKGEVGLCISQVTEQFRFIGYTDREATERKLLRDVFAPGDVWVNSGDLVRDQGFRHVQFIDRVGDTFRWKSENVSTTEVERVLNAHPAVAESTVYGVEVPDHPGRAGMAAVVPADGRNLDLDGLLAHLSRELPDYAVPVFLRIVATLETTGTFKNRKVTLQAEGFDPAKIADPLYARRHGGDRYEALTAPFADEIRAGRVRL
ncbi:MAG: AMP-binding protein [Myxococcales bacterium]|nr:AMP-binding protein [Myxococcales bacterium]